MNDQIFLPINLSTQRLLRLCDLETHGLGYVSRTDRPLMAIQLEMINPDFDAIIFDCDGTLVDSEPITVLVLVEYVREFGLDMDYEEALALFVGRDMRGIVADLESRIGHPLPGLFTDEYRKRQSAALRQDVKAIGGARDLLQAMTRPFCMASNAPRDKIEINLKVTRLDQFFTSELTFSAYDINVWKPEPDLFLYAADQMGVDPARCVVIEDSKAGIDAGLAAGSQVIGFSQNAQDKPSDEVPFVHSLVDLISVLS